MEAVCHSVPLKPYQVGGYLYYQDVLVYKDTVTQIVFSRK